MHHETIRRTLVHGAGDAPDSGAIADATLSTWHQVAVRLVPVIGARGVDALFNRSLHVTSKTYPWLAVDGQDENVAMLLSGLRARIETQQLIDAVEACHALLVNFTELLASLIGDSLTKRLLISVWVPAPTESEQENKP